MRLFSIIMCLISGPALAAGKSSLIGDYNCRAYGHVFSVNSDSLKTYWVDSRIYFLMERQQDNSVAMTEIGGHVEVSSFIEKTPEPMDVPDRYALFKIDRLAENPKYKGRRYTNHHQFREFNDTLTFGLERGMWGEFVISKDFASNKNFDAHYIMQAGDHMGAPFIILA